MQFYIPVIAHPAGDYIEERNLDACTREQVINDIFSGQIEDVTQVWCIDTETGRLLEVIEDIAIDVGQRTFERADEPHEELADWLDARGVEYFEVEYEQPDYIEHALSARQLGVGRYA